VALLLIAAAVGGFYFWHGKSDSSTINSIAVLPFVNATNDTNNEYLSDGLTESLIGTLSQFPNLKVMARSTVFRYKGKEDDPQAIGKTLQVSAVLVGRITQRNDQLGVQADLVNTSDGTEIWGSHYDRKLADVTQVQSDITRDLSAKLRGQSVGDQPPQVGRAGTNNAEAYRLYLEGRQLWYARSTEGLKKSIDLFKQAIAADPNYALAYAGLADTYNVGPSYDIGISSAQAALLSDEAARKALQLDNSIPEAHASLAMSMAIAYKWKDAEAEFKRAIELNPNYATAHYFYAFACLGPLKRIDESLAEFQKALTLDPLSPIVNVNYAVVLMYAHRYPESEAQFKKALDIDPNFPPAHYKLSQLYATQGRFKEAVSEILKSMDVRPNVTGDAKGYQKAVLSLPGTDRNAAISIAFAASGDRERAFEYLQRAYAEGNDELLLEIRYPALDPFRSDPRYRDLMKRLGLPE
jgi:TolB-like protein/tetratricopeptide (TPR) repeat protein